MQLQVECNRFSLQPEPCWLCNQDCVGEARVILCDEQGDDYGEICPDCISMGFDWIKQRFYQLNQFSKVTKTQNRFQRKLDKLVGV